MNMLGFRFLPKTTEVVEIRRNSTDAYANIAQASQIILYLCVPFCRSILRSLARRTNLWHNTRANEQVGGGSGWLRSVLGWTEGEFAIGILWFMWLLFLCCIQTHPDAIHLIRRFGLVAASQVPIHIILSAKKSISPLGFLISSPNRRNMTLHKMSGRIIICFFGFHSLGYTTVLVQSQMLRSMAQQPQITTAILSSVIFAIIGVTSTRAFRLRWYSWFHKIHYVGSITALLLLFFHNSHIKMYIVESLVALCLKKIAETIATAPN